MKAYLRKDGRYECRIQFTVTGVRVRKSFYGRTAEEAVNKAMIYKNTLSERKNVYTRQCAGTVSALVKEWFWYKKIVMKQSTSSNYHIKANKHIIPAFKDTNIYELDHKMVNDYTVELLNSGLSHNYVRGILVLFKSILKYGVQAYGMGVKLDLIVFPSKENKRIEIFSSVERKMLIDYLMKDKSPAAIASLISLCLGLRIGEVCGLCWGDIDTDLQLIHVRRTVQRIENFDRKPEENKTKVICGLPKSASSLRDIAIPDNLCRLLKKRKQDEDIYVASGTNKHYEPRRMMLEYHKLLDDAGLPSRNYHQTRHSFAQNCYEQGLDDVTLSVIMGHSSPDITRSIYIHSSIGQQRKLMALVDIPKK